MVKVCRGILGLMGLSRLGRKSRCSINKRRLQLAFGETTNAKLLFVAKLVADTPNGQDHLRVFRVLFDLGSQPIDV
jgi:uncharacterized membrane protein (Fun14 family)